MVAFKQPPKATVKRETVEQILYERRLLILVTLFAGVGVFMWLFSLSTDYWVVIMASDPAGIVLPRANPMGQTYLWSHSGLWRVCLVFNSTESAGAGSAWRLRTECSYNSFSEDTDIADFERAELAMCFVVVGLILVAAGFSIYSLIHPRYTYKRIAAALHLLTALCLVALIEMVKSTPHLTQHDIQGVVLENSVVFYGYSYLMAWVVFIIFVISSIAFFVGSRKRKNLPCDFETALI